MRHATRVLERPPEHHEPPALAMHRPALGKAPQPLAELSQRRPPPALRAQPGADQPLHRRRDAGQGQGRVRPGQAGYSIADEAQLIAAAAVVVGLRYRNGTPLYDKTLQTVLSERPCRVIVVSDRAGQKGAESAPALA